MNYQNLVNQARQLARAAQEYQGPVAGKLAEAAWVASETARLARMQNGGGK